MAKIEVRPINHERMGRWKERLNENDSTPVVLVGIGHNRVAGRIMVLCTEERTNREIVLLLHEAIKQLTGYSQSMPTNGTVREGRPMGQWPEDPGFGAFHSRRK